MRHDLSSLTPGERPCLRRARRPRRLPAPGMRPARDPAWYRGLRFLCIWVLLMAACAQIGLLLART